MKKKKKVVHRIYDNELKIMMIIIKNLYYVEENKEKIPEIVNKTKLN